MNLPIASVSGTIWRRITPTYDAPVTRRLPPQTPGEAVQIPREDEPSDDFTLPMELSRDAAIFYAMSLRYASWEHITSVRSTARYVRASIVAALSSLEAGLNSAATGHARAHRDVLEPIVLDILSEQETTIDDQGYIRQRKRPIPFNARLSFLTAFLSGKQLPRDGQLWQDLQRAVAFRDRCVHPKAPFPWADLQPADAAFVITTINAVNSEINRLMGSRPQSWWGTAEEMLEALDEGDLPAAVP